MVSQFSNSRSNRGNSGHINSSKRSLLPPGNLMLSLLAIVMLGGGRASPAAEVLSLEVFEVAKGERVLPPRESLSTFEYRFSGDLARNSLFSGMRITLVGMPTSVNDFLFLFHGDTPSYYDRRSNVGNSIPIEAELLELHENLKSYGEGLLVVQPRCSGQDWHSLYRSAAVDEKANRIVEEIQALYSGMCLHFPGECRLHLHSFSGAGRVDRALHDGLTNRLELFPTIGSEALKSWTVSDGMVNNAYSREDKLRDRSIMAVSWARFLHRYPSVQTTLIYDRSGEYPYMQGINLDVIRFLDDLDQHGQITVTPSVKIVEKGGNLRTVSVDASDILKELKANERKSSVVRLKSADSHLSTFLGEIANSYLEHRTKLREN